MKKNYISCCGVGWKNSLLYQLFLLGLINPIYSQIDLSEKYFAKLNDTLQIYKFEVSNKRYSDFLHSSEYKNDFKIKVDSTQWLKKESYSVPHASYYHNHPAFKNYPVVNISYEAAQLFCEWLTKKYNNDAARKFKKVVFRLPTEQEWTSAAKAGNNNSKYGWTGNNLTNKKGKISGNYLSEKDSMNDSQNIIESTKSFEPNAIGIYNMSGNVSEMIQEKKIVKGGDWKHNSEYCKVDAQLSWDGTPKPYIGFRFVMVVKEK